MELGDHTQATEQLRLREPIFHHAQVGSGREVFDAMTAVNYWEVGASGRVYTREYAIKALAERCSVPHEDRWAIADFEVRRLAYDLYLVTY